MPKMILKNSFYCLKKLLIGFAFFLISSLFSIVIAEFFLHVSATAIRRIQTKTANTTEWSSARRSKEVINIVALGDSYTFGGFGKNHDTYPNELSRLFLKNGQQNISVANQGVCEYTSKQILEPLQDTLLFSHADILLLLVGSADLFDPTPLTNELLSISENLEKDFRSLKIYKVIRYLFDRLEVNFYEYSLKTSTLTTENITRLANTFEDTSKRVIKFTPAELALRQKTFDQKTALLGLEDKIEIAMNLYLLKNEKPFFEIISAQIDQLHINQTQGDTCSVYEKIDNFLRVSKDYFEKHNLKDAQRSFSDRHLHAIQLGLYPCVRNSIWKTLRAVAYNKINAQSAQKSFLEATNRFPYLKSEKQGVAALLALKHREHWQGIITLNYETNLKKIITLAKKNGVVIVLQTYPISYLPINEIIRKTAKENSLILVDHEKIFAPKLVKNYRKYILNDTHCSDQGHQLMAENIFKTLTKEIFNDKKLLKKIIDHGRMIELKLQDE